MNGGLGELVRVNAKDRAAGALAERIGGEASVRFAGGPGNEFDAVSAQYVAQAKPANFTLNKAFRDQARRHSKSRRKAGEHRIFSLTARRARGCCVLSAATRTGTASSRW